MPPIPRPRSSHLSNNEENINEKQQSSIPPLSQSRARRLKQKTTPTINNEISENSTPIVTVTNEDEEPETSAINDSFIAKIRENDTLARYKREISLPGHGNQNDGIIFLSFINLSIHRLIIFIDNNTGRANASARQRRREQRFHPTTSPKEDDNNHPSTPPVYDRSISNDSQIDAVEQERKAKLDIKDFLHQLDATLHPPVSTSASSTSIEIPTIIDRTMLSTTKLEELRDALRETCLKEMSLKELNQILDILDCVGETEIKQRMIEVLDEEMYEKYSAQIYSLKYYESSLFTRQ
jgi:hypothetical protein